MAAGTTARNSDSEGAKTRFLDAAEEVLISHGHAGMTTRRLAAVADLNQGLIHYYFGSLDELFAQVLERFTARLLERQRELYRADRPFLEKWREAMSYLEVDVADGYQKVWAELYNRALNNPGLRPRLAAAYEAWRQTLREAFAQPYEDYRLHESGFTLEDWVTLVITFNEGLGMELTLGVRTGHRELVASIDSLLESWSRR